MTSTEEADDGRLRDTQQGISGIRYYSCRWMVFKEHREISNLQKHDIKEE